jgi:hypothetical protein
MIYYIMASGLLFYFFGIIWSSREVENVIAKLVFISLGIWATILTITYWTNL